MRKRGDFCLIPIKCGCPCHKEIPLKKEWITRYLTAGFPRYIYGHQLIEKKRPDSSERFKKNNPMKRPDVQEKMSKINSHPRPDLKGKKRPDSAILMKTKNPMWDEKVLDTYFRGKKRPEHSEKMKKAWERRRNSISKQLLEPDITPETKQILQTEQVKIKIALERLEAQRLEKIKEFEAKPKPVSKNGQVFGMKMCILDGKLKKCKKFKKFCKHWEFCNPKKVK